MYKSSLFTILFMFVALFSFGQSSFTGDPAAASACEGGSVTFTAYYDTDGVVASPTFQWDVGGVTMAATANNIFLTFWEVKLTISSADLADDGDAVKAQETSGSGDESATATLSVNTNPMISTPANISTCVGEDAVFSSTISGSGTSHSYSWTKSSAGTNTEFANGSGVPTGGIMGTVSSVSTDDDNSGIKLVVTDENGCSVTSDFPNTNLSVDAAPSITSQPDATAIYCSGADVTLNVAANNASTYQWKLNGADIGLANTASYTASTAGNYTVVVGNAGCTDATTGAVTSSTSAVSQSTTLAITSQPTSPNIAESETGNTSVSYTSGANTTVSWFLSGEALSNGMNTAAGTGITIVTGSGTSTVTFTNVAAGDVGKSASVTITDDCGSINSSPAVLPVEFTYFEASALENAVQLKWETATELNNEAFYVERSLDGVNFTEIAAIQGAGTSVEAIQYNHIDIAPVKGTNYYRLRQVDFDGAMEYSDVREVYFEGATFVVSVNPTTATNQVQVVLGETYEENLTVNIFDALGRNVMNTTIGAGNNVLPIDVSNFQTGQYFIKLSNNSTSITKTFFRM